MLFSVLQKYVSFSFYLLLDKKMNKYLVGDRVKYVGSKTLLQSAIIWKIYSKTLSRAVSKEEYHYDLLSDTKPHNVVAIFIRESLIKVKLSGTIDMDGIIISTHIYNIGTKVQFK